MSDLDGWLKNFWKKQCFYCQLGTSSRSNPLKETDAGNFIHKDCMKETEWLDHYGDKPLNPKLKSKSKKKEK
jgi:hypothetical protein